MPLRMPQQQLIVALPRTEAQSKYLQQRHHRLGPRIHHCQGEGCVPVLVLRPHRTPRLDEGLNEGCVAVARCVVQRRGLVFVGHVGVGACRQQRLDRRKVPALRCNVGRRVAAALSLEARGTAAADGFDLEPGQQLRRVKLKCGANPKLLPAQWMGRRPLLPTMLTSAPAATSALMLSACPPWAACNQQHGVVKLPMGLL